MGTTLQHGIFLPAEGERNCYTGLASNWTILDGVVGGYSSHAANLTIHVTAADKEAWNGKADSSALTAHTGNTTIHVTAEDKNKWDAVDNKADNTDVVHKDGNEIITGVKSFSITPYIYNSDVSSSTPNFNLRNSKVTKGTTTDNGSQIIQFLDKDLKYLAQVICNKLSNGSTALKFNVGTLDGNAQSISAEVQLYVAKNGDKRFIPSNDDDVALGRSQNRWKDVNTLLINGINPGALFLPQNSSARVDISAYLTNTANGATNRITPPEDGYIYLSLTDVVTVHCSSQTASNLTHYSQTFARPTAGVVYCLFPVRKNDNVAVQWYTTAAAVTVSNAFFIPCKGNV